MNGGHAPTKPHPGRRTALLPLIVVGSALLTIGAAQIGLFGDASAQRQPNPAQPEPAAEPIQTGSQYAAAIEQAWQQALARVSPSVVRLDITRSADEPFQPSRPGFESPAYRQRPDAPSTGLIISEAGEIVTSAFNVSGEITGINVTFADGTSAPARLIARHEPFDIALLALIHDHANGPLPTLEAGPSVDMPVGRHLAVVDRTTSPRQAGLVTGVLSARERLQRGAVQIDAPLNYGNTGGPLIDLDGRLLGLAVGIRPDFVGGQNSGIGFAMPWHLVERTLPDLRAGRSTERERRPFLGVTADLESVGIEGVRIARVYSGSGADQAGLEEGDIIVRMDDQPVRTIADIRRILRDRSVGDRLTIEYTRNRRERSTVVTLTERAF